MWSTVNKLREKTSSASANYNIDAYTFNSYFSSISYSLREWSMGYGLTAERPYSEFTTTTTI